MENEKHNISMLVELVLFPRIRAFEEDDNLGADVKETKKKEAIDVFVKECISKYQKLSAQEINDVVHMVLDRTIRHTNGDYR